MTHPTTRPLQTSITTARWKKPAQVGMYVISASHNQAQRGNLDLALHQGRRRPRALSASRRPATALARTHALDVCLAHEWGDPLTPQPDPDGRSWTLVRHAYYLLVETLSTGTRF